MQHAVDSVVRIAALSIELAGIAVMVLGLVLVCGAALVDLRRHPAMETYRRARVRLGRAILLGLELLVAADIIRTVTATPSLQSIVVLAVIVLIRTFLSFALEVELEGRPPWRRHPARGG